MSRAYQPEGKCLMLRANQMLAATGQDSNLRLEPRMSDAEKVWRRPRWEGTQITNLKTHRLTGRDARARRGIPAAVAEATSLTDQRQVLEFSLIADA